MWFTRSLSKQYQKLRQQCTGPLAAFYAAAPPEKSDNLNDTKFVAIDMETTGLEVKNEDILSIGWIPMSAEGIPLGKSRYMTVKPRRDLPPESVAFHGLFDDHLQTAPPLAEVIPEVLADLQGAVLLAHNTDIEVGFLSRACENLYGVPLKLHAIDTLRVEQRRLQRKQEVIKTGALRLGACRDRYGLPRYSAHHALVDALAAGELFLAQVRYSGDPKKLKLKHWLA